MQYHGRSSWSLVNLILVWLCIAGPVLAGPDKTPQLSLFERIERLVDNLQDTAGLGTQPEVALIIENCGDYPYAETRPLDQAHGQLVDDLRDGLKTGLNCLAGTGPQGLLHGFHQRQASRLVDLLENDQTKTIRCVADQMFATAVATGPKPLTPDDPLFDQLKMVEHPAIVLDTYRLGGLLSRTHDDETFRSFFHLSDEQIYEHRNGLPIRATSLHRYEDRPALLFHEVVHWLGHEHTATHPDMANLYETCCFGGSDYIKNDTQNRKHQQTACNILRDDDLWASGTSTYKQMRVWHHKRYGELKEAMRDDYAR